MTDEELMEKRRVEAVKRSASRKLIRDVVMLVIYCWVVFSLSYISISTDNFKVHTSIHDMFVVGNTGFQESISSEATFYKWLKNVFVPNYFVVTDVNGNQLHWRERKFLSDRAAYRVGPARLRQLRSKQENCTIPRIDMQLTCQESYSEATADHSTFGLGLQPETLTEVRYTTNAWTYTSAAVTGGLSHAGTFGTYGPDGFIIELDLNPDISTKMIDELYNNLWLDRQTRAVFLEFTIFNPNVNLFSYARLLVEKAVDGGLIPSSHIDVFRTYSIGLNGIYAYVCQGFFGLLFIYYFVMLIIDIVQTRCKCQRWALLMVDTILVLLSVYQIVFHVLRLVYAEETMVKFRANEKSFVQFSHVAMLDARYKEGWAIMTCTLTIKLCTLLRLHKRLNRLGHVLGHMAKPLFWTFIQIAVIFLGFMTLVYLFMNLYMYDFATFNRTGVTLFSFALGAFNSLDDMLLYSPLFARIFFPLFMTFVSMVYVNIFVAVIMFSHDAYKEADTLDAKDYELLEFLRQDISKAVKKSVKLVSDN